MTLPPGFILGGFGAGLTYPGGTTDFLRSDGAWAAPAGGGLTVVSETTLSSAATAIDITGLDIDTDGVYYVQLNIIGASNADLICRFNGEVADTGYVRYRPGTTAAADTFAVKITTTNATALYGHIQKITDASGNVHLSFLFGNMMLAAESMGITKSFAASTNLTQITFTASVANALGIGTTLRILKEG